MCTKIDRERFRVNKNIIPDALEFMLQTYHKGQYEKFVFWKKQLDKAVIVDFQDCTCTDLIL